MNNLEQEIADLQKMIEAKRDELEKSGGIVEEKDLVRQSVREMFLDSTEPKAGQTPTPTPLYSSSASTAAQAVLASDSYLDHLDDQTTEVINGLVAQIGTKGITSVINEVVGREPFVVDAFHDALVDKLYDELKERGLVK
ncbi:MAG: hypothetical protein WC531_02655 [Candidatus Paceibacterota bacterium]|jgi:hypothetical protein